MTPLNRLALPTVFAAVPALVLAGAALARTTADPATGSELRTQPRHEAGACDLRARERRVACLQQAGVPLGERKPVDDAASVPALQVQSARVSTTGIAPAAVQRRAPAVFAGYGAQSVGP